MIGPQVFLRLTGCHTTQQQECNKVRNSHQCIHAVGNVPDDVEIDNTAKEQGDDIEDAIETVDAVSLNVVDGTLAIVAPP